MSFCLACGGAQVLHAMDCQRRPTDYRPATVRLSDEDREWLARLVTESVTLVVAAAKTPCFGWHSTGSSWVRAGANSADVFTDSPHFPPPFDPWGKTE